MVVVGVQKVANYETEQNVDKTGVFVATSSEGRSSVDRTGSKTESIPGEELEPSACSAAVVVGDNSSSSSSSSSSFHEKEEE